MKFSPKERMNLLALLAIPFVLTFLLTFPSYQAFSATGDIVPVGELGVDGHVYFTYIEGGVTTNNLEKLVVLLSYWEEDRDVRFQPTSEEYAEFGDEEETMLDYYKETVITNAIKVSGYSDQQAAGREEKYERILARAGEYEGDSFGLMVAIGLLEEELQEDFSRGGRYKIAGTGTMEPDGTVGSIDGMTEKLMTAEEHGVTHFLLPRDKESYYEYYEGISNQEEAEQYQLSMDTQMEIVPVATLEEALAYLKSLP